MTAEQWGELQRQLGAIEAEIKGLRRDRTDDRAYVVAVSARVLSLEKDRSKIYGVGAGVSAMVAWLVSIFK